MSHSSGAKRNWFICHRSLYASKMSRSWHLLTEHMTFSHFFSSSDSHNWPVLVTATYPVTHLYNCFKMVIRLPFKVFTKWTQNSARTSGHCLSSFRNTKLLILRAPRCIEGRPDTIIFQQEGPHVVQFCMKHFLLGVSVGVIKWRAVVLNRPILIPYVFVSVFSCLSYVQHYSNTWTKRGCNRPVLSWSI